MRRPPVRVLAGELPVLVHAVLVASLVEIGLRTSTLPRLARAAGVPLRDGSTGPGAAVGGARVQLSPQERRRLRAGHRVLRHWPFPDTCLRRALLLGHLLRRREPVLVVGVTKVDGRVGAHAWLEVDGVSLDPGSTDFRVLRPAQEAV